MKEERTEGLAKVREIYQDRAQRAKELKAEGRNVVGYLCIYPVLEMMTALDLVPYRFEDPEFQESWHAKVAQRLSLPFWREVMPLIRADTLPETAPVAASRGAIHLSDNDRRHTLTQPAGPTAASQQAGSRPVGQRVIVPPGPSHSYVAAAVPAARPVS